MKQVNTESIAGYPKYESSVCTPSILLRPDGLYKTKQIAMLVKYALISRYVKRDIAPLSLILIAPPEENKTRILLQFRKIPHVKMIENLSAKPLNQLIEKQDEKQKIFHLIVLDFIRVLQHKAVVVDSVVGTLLNLVDEGVQENLFYGQQYKLKKRIQIGIITGITPPLFRKHFARWNENGAMTRFLFCSYEYSKDTVNEIHNYIMKDLPIIVDNTIAKIKQHGEKEISINDDISAGIKLFSDEVIKRLQEYYVIRHVGKSRYKVYLEMQGFRLQKMLRLLAKSIAYDRNRDVVNYEDLATLKELCDLIRLPDNPKEI